MKKYDPKAIEPKWQKIWEDTQLYKTQEKPGHPKAYVLDFFPYPSGAGLSVGHTRNYTMSDVYPRFKRMQGFNVLHPMGWDAFGLPAENYAIKNKVSPRVATDQNKANYKRQMQMLGLSYDWDREIDSTDPNYYRWTQWFFLLLYKRGLAYQADSDQWWCDTDKTVLANEQVEAGKCWRCGNLVTRKKLKQWFFRITEYADRLISDLDNLDWPEGIKQQQRNWIGRSDGAEIDFEVDDKKIKAFTTRPDTLAGATFLVLAPEHPLVPEITVGKQKAAVEKYIKKVQSESDLERQETDRPKTGVDTGAKAINPLTGAEIPVWISDYVLMGYGTGAIMAVPAHDQRDHDFAVKFDLPIQTVIEPQTGTPQENPEFRRSIVAIVRDPKTKKLLSINWGPEMGGNLFIGGGLEKGEDPVECARREIEEETGYRKLKLIAQSETVHHQYFAHSKNKARQIDANGLLFELQGQDKSPIQHEADEAGKFEVEWLSADQARQLVHDGLHRYLFDKFIDGKTYDGEGPLVNSGEFDGLVGTEAKRAIIEHLNKEGKAKGTVNYKLRDWLISRQRYWGAPIPIIHCPDDGAVPVPEEDLPVELPEVKSYEPSGNGRSPLAAVDSFVKTRCPKCGGPATRETDTMDGFACSSWYFLRFASPNETEHAFNKDAVKYWLPVDMYIGGAEHAVMHLLYARFWTKVMYDAKLIDFTEPFAALRNQGMILAGDGRKMSKSLGNVITPDEVVDQVGADALRLYEMFIAPYNQEVPWSEQGLTGTYRFLNRVWTLLQEFMAAKPQGRGNAALETALASLTHKTIKKVTDDLQDFGFNTAVAALMEFVNGLYKLKMDLPFARAPKAWWETMQVLLKLLAPFAPHITEELWSQFGKKESIHTEGWPKYLEELVKEDLIEVAVQVNGKLRAMVTLPAGSNEPAMEKAARDNEAVAKHLEGKKITKTITVPRKLVNFVTG